MSEANGHQIIPQQTEAHHCGDRFSGYPVRLTLRDPEVTDRGNRVAISGIGYGEPALSA
ncbi:MAG TPA: hypothetical protein VGE27_19230 [Gemmatimonas sp.]|uniref:hypothetical protein n=1 Tax=Gemmatimonas sp. TaxID=1962908 RepID=UPI002ED8E078